MYTLLSKTKNGLGMAVRRYPRDNTVLARRARFQRQITLHLSGGRVQNCSAQRGQGGRGLDGSLERLLLLDGARLDASVVARVRASIRRFIFFAFSGALVFFMTNRVCYLYSVSNFNKMYSFKSKLRHSVQSLKNIIRFF